MPNYKVNNETYTIPDNEVELFESDFPDAQLHYQTSDGEKYTIYAKERKDFLADFPDATELGWKSEAPEQEPAGQMPKFDPEKAGTPPVPMFDDKPNAIPLPQQEKEYNTTLAEGFKQEARNLGAGVQALAGESLNLFSGTSLDDQSALRLLNEAEKAGMSVADYTKARRMDMLRSMGKTPMDEGGRWSKEEAELLEQDAKILKVYEDALKAANGNVNQAKKILEEQAQDLTRGDAMIGKAAETLSQAKENKGWAWFGGLLPQMAGNASAIALGYLTKGRSAGLSSVLMGTPRALGLGSMAGLTASTAGMSMVEAREKGASTEDVWAVGMANAAIEWLTEKIPFDTYTKKIYGAVKSKLSKGVSEVLSSQAGREELERLLVKANQELGGKLFSGKNLSDYIKSIAEEAGGEAIAEALQTITPIIYLNPEEYPELSDVIGAAWEGAKGGLVMGAMLGGASKATEHALNKDRRKSQGYVDVAVMQTEGSDPEVVEVLSVDDENGIATVLQGGEAVEVKKDAIEGDRYRFTYAEFENARLTELEDEAIDNETVTEGQAKAAGDRVAITATELDKALAGLSEEQKQAILNDAEKDVDTIVPEDANEAYQAHREALRREREVKETLSLQQEKAKLAIRDELTEKVGGQFWREQTDAAGDNPLSLVETGKLTDGTQVYIVSEVNEAGEALGVTEDGRKMVIKNDMLQDGTQIMTLTEFIDQRYAENKGVAEQTRMLAETERRNAEVMSEAIMGSRINLGTEEAPRYGTVNTAPNADGVIILLDDGGAVSVSMDELANILGKGAILTDAELASAESAEILGAEAALKTERAQNPQQVSSATDEAVVSQKTAEEAMRLPLKADGSVDQTTLWNQDPERWAQWNDEQRQDGGANSLAYINGAIAREQAKFAEIVSAYDAEPDFDARSAMEPEIAAAQERLNRLAALQQNYAPPVAQQDQPIQTESSVESKSDETHETNVRQTVIDLYNDAELSEEEIEEYIKANIRKSQSELDKHLSKAPKMGTDISQYKEKRAKHAEKTAELEKQLRFWKDVHSYVEVPTTQFDMEPQNALEFAARELSIKDGIKLQPDSFKRHTGYGAEIGNFLSILRTKEKGGLTLEAAGERLMELDRENSTGFFDQSDPNAGLNTILDVLGGTRTSGDISSYIKANREQTAKEEVAAARNAMMEEVAADSMYKRKNRLTDANGNETTQISDLSVPESSSSLNSDESLTEAPEEERPDLVPTSDNVSSENKDGNIVESAIESEEKVEEIGDIPDDIWESSLDEDMPDFTNSASAYFPSEEMKQKFSTMRARINDWAQKLGVQVRIMETLDDVVNQSAREQILKGGKVYGYFDLATGEVTFYLPDFLSLHGRELTKKEFLSEIDKTYIHEVVAHRGLRGLLGEDKYGELCDMVWDAMTEQQKANFLNYPGVNGNSRIAADEFIAHFAEHVDYNDNRTLWDKIVDFIKDLLTFDNRIEISNEGLAEILRQSYARLAKNATATNAKQQESSEAKPERISLDEYLGRLGLSSPISDYMDDKLRNPHGLSKNQREQLEKEAALAASEYQSRRSAAIEEYAQLVSNGSIIPPTRIDILVATVNGHPDNAATQAARRSLEKRGYDWQTGQKKAAEVKTESEKVFKTVKAEKVNDEKIEDFGEKIGGARKDVARAKIRDSVKLTTKDLVELKDPDKILSRKNIIKYYSEGAMTYEDAVKLLAMNMAVRGRDTIDRGVAMKKYRNLAMAWESGAELIVEITDEDVQNRMNEYSERMRQTPDFEKKTRESLELFVLKVYNDYKATYEALNYPEVYRNLKSAYIRYGDHDGKYWVVGGPNAYRGYPFPTLEQALAKMVKLYPEEAVAKKPSDSKKGGEKSSSIHVTKDKAGYYRIKSRNIPGEIYLSGKLYSKKDAEAYLAENLDKLVERENRLLEALLGSNIGMVEREGLDYRKGKDVTPQDFLDTFGFRGVEFGNWVPQVERQAYLNKTYDTIMDFCRIVGISPKAFSLGGRLGLAFGSRGKSRALAHYEPLKEVINLTRMKGAGSLAHEWFHALDNYLAKQRSGNTSDMTTDNKPALRQEVTDAFNAFVSAMNRLAYTRRSNRAGQYWGEVWERAARLFESYIYNELGGQNIVSPLLVKKDTLYVDHGEFSDDAWPYPSAEENEQMKPYFDRLFSTLQEQVEEDGNVTLFRAEDAGRKQAQFDIINETNPMTDDYHVGIRKVEDIKTFDEVMEAARRESEEGGWPELASYPDIENSLLEDALETRKIVIYSSHPISNGTFVTPSYMQADEYSGMTGEVYSKEVSVDDIAWINTDEGQYASLNDATDRYNDTPDEDIRFRTEQTKDRVENLFTAAVNGTFKGKPVSIGTLTKEGKQYLESISGLTFKDKVDFMLNASDLVHMYNEHFGENEKDPGSNIPLTIDDIRNIVDVVLNPEKVLYLGEDEGKRFAFLAPADSGAYNLIEVYTTKRGNLSSKTFYKTKKGVSHRAMILEKESRHSTSETNGATLSDAKIPILFDIANQGNDNTLFRTRITPEQDAAYMKAVEAGDMETAQKMVLEAAKLAMPNTKVVDESGNPMVVYHGTLAKNLTRFNKDLIGSRYSYDEKGFFFISRESIAKDYATPDFGTGSGTIIPAFINLENPLFVNQKWATKNGLGSRVFKDNDVIEFWDNYQTLMIEESEDKDGVIISDGTDIMVVAFEPSQIKSADPVTYDNAGNVIPLSERFNEEKSDIRFRTTEIIPEVREEMAKIKESAERNGTYLKAPNGQPTNLTPEQWMMVRTEGFKYWFGDWEKDPENASKVIDINGEPRVVYHGTQSKFTAFDVGYKGKNFGFRLSDGFYFSPDETVAESYASFPDELKTGEVKAVFLNIINPFHIKSAKDYREQIKEIVSLAARGNRYQADLVAGMSESELLSQRGYDGVVEKRTDGITGEIVVFEPNQIKSATDNTGVFSVYYDIRFRTRYDVNTNPTEAQKKAGNYKMGHLRLDGYNITIENPKGSVRRGTDSKGNAWENTLNNDYGYIRGTEGVDGDHIDVYLSDNPTEGNVFVVDQVNPETREFDEHKVMYGFNSAEEAREAYLANFSEGWNGLGTITEVSKDEFKKWIESSHRKTKPFSEYKSVRANEMQTTDESDLRYRVVTNQETLDRLNSEPTIKVYRAMQLIDGKLYPPMSAKVDGELRQPIELGQWEEAEERPDLVDEKGRFKLDKGNKSSLKARYNPYFHTSPTPLNDQFSSAQTRPELVTVEVEVPESELTSGYKAEKAKDAVGKLEWKAGVVQSKLSGTRTVILSRWDKPVRIVPDSEVADVIVDMFEGKDITMPSNVVTPSLRAELEKRGVPFVETDNQGNPVEEVSFRVTGTPTDEVVTNGLRLTPSQTATLAGNIFSALPEESRERITDGLGSIADLQDAILQIPTSLVTKESWSDEDRAVAEVVAEQMTKMAGDMTRPFSAPEALWLLYNNLNRATDLVSEASRALVRRNLGFDDETLVQQEQAKEDVRFRSVSNANNETTAKLYNKGAVNVWTRLKESFVDMNASVDELVKAMVKRSGKEPKGFEDIRLALNQQSSKGLAAMEGYERKFLNPMLDAISDIIRKTKKSYDQIVRYVILKHGLERNDSFAKRDAREYYGEMFKKVADRMKNQSHAQRVVNLSEAKKALTAVEAKMVNAKGDKLERLKEEREAAMFEVTVAELVLRGNEKQNESDLKARMDAIDAGTDAKYQELRNKDYSGITSMFYDQLDVDRNKYDTEEEYQAALMEAKQDKYATLADVETAAQAEVDAFEKDVNTAKLWKRINAATKETLRQQYEANMISKEQYETLRDMFQFYVPLRGFADNTAEDMYTYYRKPNSTGYTKPILGAEGRKTEAESPFGWIAAMANSAIASNVKNEAKLALFYFVSNRPDNGIATISKTWFEFSHTDPATGKKVYKPAYPPFTEGLSSDQARADFEQWQEDMKAKRAAGQAYESGQRLNLGNAVVNISDRNRPEHIVNVKVAGKDYTIIINGNPRAAQAINGDLNIEATAGDYSKVFGPILRWMSSVNTSYNPEFWITNMQRDVLFTLMNVTASQSPAYRKKFASNYAKAFKVIFMAGKNERGTLGNSYIEKMYQEFVENGGVTGYTQIKDNEVWEKDIENYMKSANMEDKKMGRILSGTKDALHVFHRFGESMEQVSRFAAFLTSREMGMSMAESINSAKEITVNFNRKGSGKMISWEETKKLTGKDGNPLNDLERLLVWGISSMAPLGRRFIMFFNASIQGLNAMYKLYKNNPSKMTAWSLGYLSLGVMQALLHAMMDDDDDYLDIPQYERRTSLMLGGNGTYLKWALPQEARAFYALGDLAVESIMGRNPHQNVIMEALKIGADIAPVNPTEGWKAFLPSVAVPFVELMINEDWKGDPIYNEQKWLTSEERKRTAKAAGAYQGTGKMYIWISEALNNISGGDDYDAGLINIQPEKMEHLVQSAFGGTIRTADKFFNTIMAAIDPEEEWTVKQTPFLNRLLTINDERFRNVHVNEVYDYYKAEAEHAKILQKKYTKDRDMDAYRDLMNSDEMQWSRIYERYKKPIMNLQEKIKVAEGTAERRELMKQQDELKRRMIKEISELSR